MWNSVRDSSVPRGLVLATQCALLGIVALAASMFGFQRRRTIAGSGPTIPNGGHTIRRWDCDSPAGGSSWLGIVRGVRDRGVPSPRSDKAYRRKAFAHIPARVHVRFDNVPIRYPKVYRTRNCRDLMPCIRGYASFVRLGEVRRGFPAQLQSQSLPVEHGNSGKK